MVTFDCFRKYYLGVETGEKSLNKTDTFKAAAVAGTISAIVSTPLDTYKNLKLSGVPLTFRDFNFFKMYRGVHYSIPRIVGFSCIMYTVLDLL